jgi:methionyl-tRNA synthetase
VPFDADGSFSWERFEERYNADLANSFGNLASRAIAMVEKYRESIVPTGAPTEIDRADAADIEEYHAALDGDRGRLLHEGLKRVMATVARGNEFVQASQPWALAKDPAKAGELDAVLAAIVRQLARQAVLLFPFMPDKAQELWVQLGGPGNVGDQRFSNLPGLDVTGWRVAKGPALFPKKQEGREDRKLKAQS